MIHTPVLVKEVLEYLDPKPNENFVDATCGEGGHAIEILQRTGPNGKLLGIDADPAQVEHCKATTKEFSARVVVENGSYAHIQDIAARKEFGLVHGILADLGYSSWHMESSGKGFSFQKDEPLDMRYSGAGELTAEIIVNEWLEEEIRKILEEYGEEKFSKKIAKEIIQQRKTRRIKTTFALRDIIEKIVARQGKIHPATRTFQALRIAVNGELDALTAFLPQALELLAPQGRLAVISFHSLEDRIVKQFFNNQKGLKVLTKKPISALPEEILLNPRARSAKLRVITKL